MRNRARKTPFFHRIMHQRRLMLLLFVLSMCGTAQNPHASGKDVAFAREFYFPGIRHIGVTRADSDANCIPYATVPRLVESLNVSFPSYRFTTLPIDKLLVLPIVRGESSVSDYGVDALLVLRAYRSCADQHRSFGFILLKRTVPWDRLGPSSIEDLVQWTTDELRLLLPSR